jgi:hypothetical protein
LWVLSWFALEGFRVLSMEKHILVVRIYGLRFLTEENQFMKDLEFWEASLFFWDLGFVQRKFKEKKKTFVCVSTWCGIVVFLMKEIPEPRNHTSQ